MNKRNQLKSIDAIAETLGKEGLRDLGYNLPVEGKVTAQEVIILNKAEEELPFVSNVAKVGDIELQEIQRMQQETWKISSSNSSLTPLELTRV